VAAEKKRPIIRGFRGVNVALGLGVGFVTPTATQAGYRTPVLPGVLIGGINQLIVVGLCRTVLYKGGDRLRAHLTKFVVT
jgi:hypothetical protein